MAQSFNLTAQINLQAPSNLKTIVSQIRREFGTVSADVKLNISAQSAKSIDNIRTRLDAMNASLIQARNNTTALDSALETFHLRCLLFNLILVKLILLLPKRLPQ